MKKALLSIGAVLTVLSVNAQQRVPLFEVFTSSTCPPCNAGNSIYEGVLAGKPKTDYVSIKYQQKFPSTGDPYATQESVWAVGGRPSYYITASSWGIPYMNIDGGWGQNAQSFTQALYDQYRAVPPQYTITGYYYIVGNRVTAKISYKALTTVPAGTKIFAAVTEAQTVKNVKTNGETKFFNVMKKMMPTIDGTTITEVTAGQTGTLTLSYTFPGSYRLPVDGQPSHYINTATENSVEHFDSLKVVAWVQGADKSVYQAGNMSKASPTEISSVAAMSEVTVFPNPASNVINLSVSMKEADKVTAVLYDMMGNVVSKQSTTMLSGKGNMTISTQNVASGMYNVVIFDSNNNSNTQRVSVVH